MNFNPAQSGRADAVPMSAATEREPFAADIEDDFYYSETQRAKCLHFLLHLAPYSDVLLLTGAQGSGKTSLIRQFVNRASPSWRICNLDAEDVPDPRRLLEAMAEVFLFDIGEDLEATLAQVRKMLQTLRKSALVPVLIIDEAHRLPLSVLELLGRLVETATPEERLLCIILVGEHALEERLRDEALGALRARVGHSFELPPFDEEETARYVQHRLRVAGADQQAFTPASLKRIHEESGGLPGRINECAREALQTGAGGQQKETPPAPVMAAPGRGKAGRGLGRRLGLGLLAVVLVGVLWFQDEINRWFEGGDEAVQSRDLSPPPPLAQATPVPEPRPPAAEEATVADEVDEVHAETQPAGRAAQTSQMDIEPDGKAVARTDSVAEENPPPGPVPGAESPAAIASNSSTVTGQSPTPSSELLNQDWLRARDPGRYTLQLLAMNKSRVMELVAQWGLSETGEAATFYTRRPSDGRRLLALVYGDYPDHETARAAIPEVRRRFPGIEPWVRPFGAIHPFLEASPSINVPAPAPGGATVAPPALGDVQVRLERDEQRLLDRTPDRYVVQLMALDLAAVERRVRRWGIGDEVYYYRTLRGDRELVAVLYGDYPDKAAAETAARELPRRLAGISPWVRTVSEVQDTIRAFRAIRR